MSRTRIWRIGREGHLLIKVKALYGLKSSGLRWHERCAQVLRELGFLPYKADPDVWLRDAKTYYEYIGVYVDDLEIAYRNPQEIIDQLIDVYRFRLKGTG